MNKSARLGRGTKQQRGGNAPFYNLQMNQDQTPADDLVPMPLRVSKARKALWVQLSRAEGKKLTDWIVERVERDLPPNGQPGATHANS